MIYLDANADSPPCREALDAYLEQASARLTLSSAQRTARSYRDRILKALGAREGAMWVTRGGTLADAVALELAIGDGGHVVTSGIEHAAVSESLRLLEAQGRCTVSRVAVSRNGRVDVQEVAAALRPDTVLLSVIAASNETGVLQPIEELAMLARRRRILFHTDAVQTVGRMPIELHRWGVDFASFSAHKFGAVSGIGLVYVRDPLRVDEPLVESTDEFDLPGLASTAAALDRVEIMTPDLRDRFERRLSALSDIECIGAASPRLSNTSLVRFGGCEADGLMMALDVEGFATSTGSACASGSIEPSPILLAMGLSSAAASEAVRFSFGPSTTEQDVDSAANAVCRVVELMRSL